MSAITFSGLGKSFGARVLFEDVSMNLEAGHRYGLVGANGAGKTTLLRILAGDDTPSEGSLGMQKGARLGVLRQDRFLDESARVIDLAMQGDEQTYRDLQDYEQLVLQGDAERASEIEERLRLASGWALEARAAEVLDGLGIGTESHKRPLSELSGGFKLRVLLSQVLLGRPDVLLLDEPTNHLDIVSIRWLEDFLQTYEGCAVVVSHDQRFLDNVCTHILDVDFETILLYHGNFTKFETDKALIVAQKVTEVSRAEEIVAQKLAFVERFRAKATKARQAQSRLKQIEKIEIEEIKSSSRRAPHLDFSPERPSGRDVLKAEGIDKAYGAKVVLTGVTLSVRRGERVAVIGKNGLGKSTLLRILAGHGNADAGDLSWGHEVRLGYFPQDHKELIPDPNVKVIDYLYDTCPSETVSFVRGKLGAVLFSGDSVDKKVGSLSGGEAARLLFARIGVMRPNVLLLDEPTNHLDLEAVRELARAAKVFDGTLIFVSHNRWFVSELATRVIEVTETGTVDFNGGYEDYLRKCGQDHLDAEAVLKQAKAKLQSGATEAAPSGDDWEEQKRKRNREKNLRDRSVKVTQLMEQQEAALAKLRERLYQDDLYESTSQDEIQKLTAQEAKLAAEVDALLAEWESIETELAGA